ncbi:MAG: hypothetical protein ACTSRS_01235 [Candidatus Helarchaeota archaeon]
MKRSGISNSGNYFNTGRKNGYRVVLIEKSNYQAIFLFFQARNGTSEGYVWLTREKIRRLWQLLDRDHSDILYLNGKNLTLKIEKREENTGIMTLRDKYDHFLDYFWLSTDDIIDLMRVLDRIRPKERN